MPKYDEAGVSGLMRDLRKRLEQFRGEYPAVTGTGLVFELTVYDENRGALTIGDVIGTGPSVSERINLALARLRAAGEEVEQVMGTRPAIRQLRKEIEHLIADFEGGSDRARTNLN